MLFTSNCEYCTKTNFIFCDVWQHFWSNPCYYNNRKNPPIHYIKFYYPHSKIPSPKEQRSIAVLLLYAKSGAMLMHRPASLLLHIFSRFIIQ